MENVTTTQGNIVIRTTLQPGDIGYITWLHGSLYAKEYAYGIAFERYVAEGLADFHRRYDPHKDRMWICERDNQIIGCLLLMHQEDQVAQLRYFLLLPEVRGLGLGRQLMVLFLAFLKEKQYKKAFLWTTEELTAAAILYKKAGFKLKEEHTSDSFGKVVKEQKYELVMGV